MMLNKLVDKVKDEIKKASQSGTIHPEIFQDPMADQINWDPLKPGGASFKTHKVYKIDESKLEVRPSTFSKIFVHIFMVIGAGILSYVLYSLYASGWQFIDSDFIFLGVGIVFSIVSVVMDKLLAQKKFFDKTSGYYWVGKKGPRQVYDPKEDKRFTSLESIYALQIIRERVKSEDSNYNSYELNMICKDKSRVNVMDHSNYDALLEDAQMISMFLEVPLWDGGEW